MTCSFYSPLHLAIIHENLSLTYYLVKLIVGVSMNLDIANNLRQVCIVSYGLIVTELHNILYRAVNLDVLAIPM